MSEISSHVRNTDLGDSSFIVGGRDIPFTDQPLGGTQRTLSVSSPIMRRTLEEVKRSGFEEVGVGDLIVREDVSSKGFVVRLQTNPFRPRTLLKLRKTVQFAEISYDESDRRYSVVTLHPADAGNNEEIWKLWRQVYQYSSIGPRRAHISQLFGLCRSSRPALVFHDELVDGEDILNQYTKTPVVHAYLRYRHVISYRAIFEDGVSKSLAIPLSDQYRNWVFNRTTRIWQYDVASIALSDVKDDSVVVLFDNPPFLSERLNPQLDPREILSELPDYLQLISTLKLKSDIQDLEILSRQGILTFGTLIDRTKPGVIAHFPSVSSPRWYTKSMNLDVQARYSTKVPARLDLEFVKGFGKLNLRFSLRLTLEERQRLRVAYLTQSSSVNAKDTMRSDLLLVEEIRFKLGVNSISDPLSHNPPIYLFVPPPSLEWMNSVPSVRWPLTTPFFYWSFDREGKNSIAREDWHQYGLPELKIKGIRIGSSWPEVLYAAAQDYLALKNYDLSGERFAIEHGYPVLIKGDPLVSV